MQDMVVNNIMHRKPDFTAWFVLQGTIAVMHSPYFYDVGNEESLKLYKILAFEAGKTRLLSKIIHRLPYSWQYKIGELVTNSGRLRHFYLRKKEIEKNVRKILVEHNIKQVIVLGAGLDVLALRIAKEFTDVKFIEIDRGASQKFKTESLAAHDINIPENMELIAGDLRDPLVGILAQSKFHNPASKALWIAEGLLMFIDEESVTRIFQQTRENSALGSYCIFTTLEAAQGSFLSRIIQKLYLRKEKCSYNWTIPSQKIPRFMKKFAFQVMGQISSNLLHKDYISHESDINRNIGDDIHIVRFLG